MAMRDEVLAGLRDVLRDVLLAQDSLAQARRDEARRLGLLAQVSLTDAKVVGLPDEAVPDEAVRDERAALERFPYESVGWDKWLKVRRIYRSRTGGTRCARPTLRDLDTQTETTLEDEAVPDELLAKAKRIEARRVERAASEMPRVWKRLGFFLPSSSREKILGPDLAEHASDFYAALSAAETRGEQDRLIFSFTVKAVVKVFNCGFSTVKRRLRDEFAWVTGSLTRE